MVAILFMKNKEATLIEEWNPQFQEIWNLAEPYYEKARPFDLEHVRWMSESAKKVCEEERLDPMILQAAAALHDIGYSGMDAQDSMRPTVKIRHMQRGVRIAGDILEKVNFPVDKMLKVLYLIGEHDDWALGIDEVYKEDSLVAILSDLDFTYLATQEGFEVVRNSLGKNPQEMIDFLRTNEKHTKRPFATKTTQALFEQYLEERVKQFSV